MIDAHYSKIIVVIVGILSGCALGIFQASKTELTKRGIPQVTINPLQKVSLSDAVGSFLNAMIIITLLIVVPFMISFGLFKLIGIFGKHGLGQSLGGLYCIAWVGGVMTARLARYLHWRSK